MAAVVGRAGLERAHRVAARGKRAADAVLVELGRVGDLQLDGVVAGLPHGGQIAVELVPLAIRRRIGQDIAEFHGINPFAAGWRRRLTSSVMPVM